MIYADTSILTSLVLRDRHSEAALDLLEKAGKPFAFNRLLKLEVGNAMRLCLADRKMTERDVSISESIIDELVSSRKWEEIEPAWDRVFERARGLSLAHTKSTKARSLDILHVACAMELQLREFWTFDERQKNLAELAGFKVNPLG